MAGAITPTAPLTREGLPSLVHTIQVSGKEFPLSSRKNDSQAILAPVPAFLPKIARS